MGPRNNLGQFVAKECPRPDCYGKYQHEGEGFWGCDGLIENNVTGALVVCPQYHQDGTPASVK